MKRVVHHHEMKIAEPGILPNPKECKAAGVLLNNLKQTMVATKRQRNHDIWRARTSTLVMASSTKSRCNSTMAGLLGCMRSTIATAALRKSVAVLGNGPWSSFQRRLRCDSLTPACKQSITEFWKQNSRLSPCKKDVVNTVGESGFRISYPLHLMEVTQLQLFQQYKKAHPKHPVCLKAFEKLKPIYVKKVSERETCCCIYHMKLEYARVGLNALRSAKTGFHGEECKCCCEVCGPGEKCLASQHTYDSTSELWRAVVCNQSEGEEWYKHDCLMQTCQKCGIKTLPICPRERENHEFLLEWKTFEKTLLQIPVETEEAGGVADCVTKEVSGGSRKKRSNATKKGNKSKKSKVAGGTQPEAAAQAEKKGNKSKKSKVAGGTQPEAAAQDETSNGKGKKKGTKASP